MLGRRSARGEEMEIQYTFIDLINDVFNSTKTPMSPEEIWEKAVELSLDKKLGSTGKTPWATIGARLYTNIKEQQDDSVYIQVSKRPSKFILRTYYTNPIKTQEVIEQQIKIKDEIMRESQGFDSPRSHVKTPASGAG
jgi:hypothetical protein